MMQVILKLRKEYYKEGRWDLSKDYFLREKNSRFPQTRIWIWKSGKVFLRDEPFVS